MTERDTSSGMFPNAPAEWRRNAVTVRAGDRLFEAEEGDGRISFVLQGWGCRSRLLHHGGRQIMELLLPGDHSSMRWCGVAFDDQVTALSVCSVAKVPVAAVRAALGSSQAFQSDVSAAEHRRISMLEERLVSLGRRDALCAMAHVFCELLIRAEVQAGAGLCDCPLTQADLADTLGLSVVHVNRTLKSLRAMGLADLKGGRLRTTDFGGLAAKAGFTAAYLH